jgi:hypothetical protein
MMAMVRVKDKVRVRVWRLLTVSYPLKRAEERRL